MVKRMKRSRYHETTPIKAVVGSDEEEFSDADDVLKDEIDEFHLQQEKVLLDETLLRRKKDQDDDEEEVLPVHSSSADEEEEADRDDVDMASDLEERDDDDLPDPKAWGKKKSMYYTTDYIDEDFGGFEGADAEAAEMEEKEALALQQKLMQQLDEDDFDLGLFKPSARLPEEKEVTEKVKKDFSELSERDKIELIRTESPELLGLIKEFQDKVSDLNTTWLKLEQLVKEKKIPDGAAAEYIKVKCHIMLNYCVNISHYMTLKAMRQVENSHPVMRRITNYYNLLKETSPLDSVLKPQIAEILKQLEETGHYETITITKRRQKKVKFSSPQKSLEEDDLEMPKMVDLPVPSLEGVSDKRGIDYQIAKNKGLTPHRKKEQRNPRVKHRIKYKKAKIRRKGQVREARKELVRYGGEISGIKANVSKSIKLK